jgi:hypothetical protein
MVIVPSRGRTFPRVLTRDLERAIRWLPDELEGERNIVIVAFHRRQQALVDSWVPWLEERIAQDPTLRFYEVPTIGVRWSPMRSFIDGGMATAIRDRSVRRRTLTLYTDVRRVTDALGIGDRSTTWLFLVDRFRPLLALVGVTPSTAHVTITADRLLARFGPWSLTTELTNVSCVRTTGPYRWYRAIGPRGSLADRGLTFGTSTRGGVCVEFHRPVHGLDPFGAIAHPGATLTVARRDELVSLVRERAGV